MATSTSVKLALRPFLERIIVQTCTGVIPDAQLKELKLGLVLLKPPVQDVDTWAVAYCLQLKKDDTMVAGLKQMLKELAELKEPGGGRVCPSIEVTDTVLLQTLLNTNVMVLSSLAEHQAAMLLELGIAKKTTADGVAHDIVEEKVMTTETLKDLLALYEECSSCVHPMGIMPGPALVRSMWSGLNQVPPLLKVYDLGMVRTMLGGDATAGGGLG